MLSLNEASGLHFPSGGGWLLGKILPPLAHIFPVLQCWSILLEHFVFMIKMQGLLPFPAACSSSEAEANQQCRDKRRLNSKWVQSVSASVYQKGNLKSMKPLQKLAPSSGLISFLQLHWNNFFGCYLNIQSNWKYSVLFYWNRNLAFIFLLERETGFKFSKNKARRVFLTCYMYIIISTLITN